jgi:hypothetical protein
MKTFAIRTMIVMGSLSALGWAAVGGSSYFPRIVYADKQVDNSQAILSQKIETLKDAVVTDVGPNCESKGRITKNDPVIILDTNNKASIGVMQWQVSSVISYYKTLYKRDLTPKEAVMIALDDEKAMSLAKDVMFTTKNKASGDWVTCAKRMNADARIDIIKSL